jgi:replicative superfamily II helicase
MGELKSALEIALEKSKKMGGDEEIVRLSSNQKNEIAEIRKVYEAKIAEVEILIQEPEKREKEMERLKREIERKLETFYQKAKQKA